MVSLNPQMPQHPQISQSPIKTSSSAQASTSSSSYVSSPPVSHSGTEAVSTQLNREVSGKQSSRMLNSLGKGLKFIAKGLVCGFVSAVIVGAFTASGAALGSFGGPIGAGVGAGIGGLVGIAVATKWLGEVYAKPISYEQALENAKLEAANRKSN